MMLIETDLPPMDDGDRIWFAMILDGAAVDCYVDRDVLNALRRGPAHDFLGRFTVYRPVFEAVIRDLHLEGRELVAAVETLSCLWMFRGYAEGILE